MTSEEIARAEDGAPRPRIPVADIAITGLRLERLGSIDVRSAKAEGLRTTDDFKVAWVQARDRRWHAQFDGETPPDAALARFADRYADRLVWAITFTVGDSPRLLAANTSRGDYTTDPRLAMNREAEAVPADMQAYYSQIAREAERTGGAADVSTTINSLRAGLGALRASDQLGIVDHREIQREISRMERSLQALTSRLAARMP